MKFDVVVVELAVVVVTSTVEWCGIDKFHNMHSCKSLTLHAHGFNSTMCMDNINYHFTGRNSILSNLTITHFTQHVKTLSIIKFDAEFNKNYTECIELQDKICLRNMNVKMTCK